MSSGAWSQTTTPEALPGGISYPDPQCTRPRVNLVKPGALNDNSGAVNTYNLKVKAFNREGAAYNSCMHAYLDQANRDVKVIQEKANADLKQITERANASMKVIQDKIRHAVADANDVAASLDNETAKLRK